MRKWLLAGLVVFGLACNLSQQAPETPVFSPINAIVTQPILSPTVSPSPLPLASLTPTPLPPSATPAPTLSFPDETAFSSLTSETIRCRGENGLLARSGLANEPRTHTVASGETLSGIALFYGMTLEDLIAFNNISNAANISVGQQIIIIPAQELPSQPDPATFPPLVTSLELIPSAFFTGETGCVYLTTALPSQIEGTFLNEAVRVISFESRTGHIILTGIPLNVAPQMHPLTLHITASDGSNTDFTLNIPVFSAVYGSQALTLPDDRLALLDPAIEQAEVERLQTLSRPFTPTRYFSTFFALPSQALINATFGISRSYNGGPFDRNHIGVDFSAPPGESFRAASSGIVVFAGALDVRGLTTVIDHGWGIYSVYCHQTEQYVSEGDFVIEDQVIGTVGASGRATGAHLHWEIWVNGVPVNPLQWVTD